MSLEPIFLRDIRKHPEDPMPRLIFADWLEEHDDPRAAFLRDLSPLESRYEFNDRIGYDGPDEGYQALDRRTQRIVAVNVAHLHDDPVLDRLWKEATVLTRCRHPHLLPLLDLGFDDAGRTFLARPAIEGEDLLGFLLRWEKGPPSGTFWSTLPRLVHALSAAASAVACAHQHGFIHRSLAPSAIFLGSRRDEVFVGEWDDAATREEYQSSDGFIMGIVAYMAPEQILSPQTVTPRADIYGLGGILYELLYVRPPNVRSGMSESSQEIIRRAGEPKMRGVLRPGLWPNTTAPLSRPGFFSRLFGAAPSRTPSPIQALEDICLRALEIEPSRRQPSMAALAAELDDWLARYGD